MTDVWGFWKDVTLLDMTNNIKPSDLKVVFMGTPDFAVPSLLSLINEGFKVIAVVTQPDKPQGRHMVMTMPPVKSVAIANNIPVIQPEKIRNDNFTKIITEMAPDLIITAAYGKILPEVILNIPKFGCVNVHASILPRYRGAAPVQWCIINGDEHSGVTIMLMDKGMDTGDILLQKELEIGYETTSAELMDNISKLGAQVLCGTIIDYCNGHIKASPQDINNATSIKPIRKEDGLIDWNDGTQSIHNKIRGCNPWPIAFTFYKGKRLKVFKAIPWKDLSDICFTDYFDLPNGSILVSETKNNLYVVCGDGILEILELALEGSRKMMASECAHNFQEGIFGT